jgi:hypothetical protein
MTDDLVTRCERAIYNPYTGHLYSITTNIVRSIITEIEKTHAIVPREPTEEMLNGLKQLVAFAERTRRLAEKRT